MNMKSMLKKSGYFPLGIFFVDFDYRLNKEIMKKILYSCYLTALGHY